MTVDIPGVMISCMPPLPRHRAPVSTSRSSTETSGDARVIHLASGAVRPLTDVRKTLFYFTLWTEAQFEVI
jgi:hypothetical protein